MIADAAPKMKQDTRNLSTSTNIPMGTRPIPILMSMIMNMIRKQEGSSIMIINMTNSLPAGF